MRVDPSALARTVAQQARRQGLTLAVAESLTCGRLASGLGAGPGASEWFRGGVVAYHAQVKYDVLGVSPGPVVTPRCALEMAQGVRALTGADVALGVTGVGGPGPEEGRAAGTVHLAVVREALSLHRDLRLPGRPPQVLRVTVAESMLLLLDALAVRTGPALPGAAASAGGRLAR